MPWPRAVSAVQVQHLCACCRACAFAARRPIEFFPSPPFTLQGPDGRTHNPQFMEQVRQAFPDPSQAKLCVACGGGTRGTSAAAAIAEAGYRWAGGEVWRVSLVVRLICCCCCCYCRRGHCPALVRTGAGYQGTLHGSMLGNDSWGMTRLSGAMLLPATWCTETYFPRCLASPSSPLPAAPSHACPVSTLQTACPARVQQLLVVRLWP